MSKLNRKLVLVEKIEFKHFCCYVDPWEVRVYNVFTLGLRRSISWSFKNIYIYKSYGKVLSEAKICLIKIK